MSLLKPDNYSTRCKNVLENMYRFSYNYICAEENFSTAPLAYFHYKVGVKEIYIFRRERQYNANRTVCLDRTTNKNGKYVVLPVKRTVQYMKFSLALNIYTNDDNKDRKANKLSLSIQSLAERSALNRTSLEIYVDNIKVPDTEVFITVLNGSTDIYVPASYYKPVDSYMDLILRKYNKSEPYMNYVLSNYSEVSDRVLISITGATLQDGNGKDNIKTLSEANYDFTKDDLRIYRNGVYLYEDYDYSLDFDENDKNKFEFIMLNNVAIQTSLLLTNAE